MCKKSFNNHLLIIILATLLATGLFSCGKKKDASSGINLPEFEQKFPQKNVWVHYDASDSMDVTFSSMEEAEWKLIHVVPSCSFESFEKILLSDPSSMDYPFDSLFSDDKSFCDLCKPVTSDDGNMRCFRVFPHLAHEMPMMLAYCRINGKVQKAEELGQSEDCYYCLSPDTIYTFNTGHSTLYFVWGYNGYLGNGVSYRLCAYELDSKGLRPAFVFSEDGGFSGWEEDGQSLYVEICYDDDLCDTLAKDHFRSLGYFDPKESAVYIRTYEYNEKEDRCCSTHLTNHYRKFVWNGKKFMCK